MDAMLLTIWSSAPKHPDLMIIDPKPHAMLRAGMEFAGRNHRRIKREMNKAWRAARKAELAARGGRRTPEPRPSPAFQFWRQQPGSDQATGR